MSAKEMFEKLEYEYKENENYISYTYCVKEIIEFSLKTKKFVKEDIWGTSLRITLEELKAINKQIEELGWNNE